LDGIKSHAQKGSFYVFLIGCTVVPYLTIEIRARNRRSFSTASGSCGEEICLGSWGWSADSCGLRGKKNWQLKQDVQKISKISKLLQLRKAGAGAGCTSKHSISKGESNESNESNSHVCVVQGLERPARSRRRLDEKPVDVV